MVHRQTVLWYPSFPNQTTEKLMWLWWKPKRFWGRLDSFQIYDSINISRFISQFWNRKRENLFYYIEDVTKPKSGTLEDADK